MERITIYNDDLEEIGSKLRRNLTGTDTIRIAALLLKKDDAVLLAQRSRKKDTYPEHWSFSAAGLPEHGEQLKKAIVREAKEELGVNVEPRRAGKLRSSKHRVVTWFTAEHNGEELVLQQGEVERVKWIQKADIHLFLEENEMMPGVEEALQEVFR